MRLKLISSLMLVMLVLVGCTGGSSNKEVQSSGESVSFNYKLTSTYAGSETKKNTKALSVYNGQILVKNLDTNEENTLDWYATVNDENFSVTSNKTVVLKPGNYQFSLLLQNGNKQYLSTKVFEVQDGVASDVALDVRPLIGTLLTNVNQVQNIPSLKLKYDTNDLTSYESPKISLGIDGADVESYDVNPTTGLSDVYVNLTEGSHEVTLDFYNGNIYLGKASNYPATVNIEPNVDVDIDLVPLQSTTSFSLTNNGGFLAIAIGVPEHVITEVNGLNNLKTILRYTGANNVTGEQEVVVVEVEDGEYKGFINLTNIYYGDMTLSLEFIDKAANNEIVGSLDINQIALNDTDQTINASVNLKRRAFLTGNLLSTIAINVYDENNQAVEGASIYANDELLGIVSDGTLNTKGYFQDNLKKGTYTIKAIKDSKEASSEITISSLEVYNLDLTLDISTPVNNEVLVNTHKEGDQKHSSVAQLKNGDYIVAWNSNFVQSGLTMPALMKQRLNSNFEKIGTEIVFEDSTQGSWNFPDIVALDDGGYIIVWTSFNNNIVLQKYNSVDEKVGAEIIVNTSSDTMSYPQIIELADNNLVVFWQGRNTGQYLQKLSANGEKIGSEVLVTENKDFLSFFPKLKAISDNQFAITWATHSGGGVTLQRFDHSLNRVGDLIQVYDNQSYSNLVAVNSESFAVIWAGDTNGVDIQLYNFEGVKIGSKINLRSEDDSSSQRYANAEKIDDNSFIVMWSNYTNGTQGDGSLIAQKISANGEKIGDEVSYTIGLSYDAIFNTTRSNDGNIVATWGENDSRDGSQLGVVIKKFE